jgi:hypothetical protein
MDSDIRPISQAPGFVDDYPANNRDSWKTAPNSPRENFKVRVDAVTEERGISSSDASKSSRSPYTPRKNYSEKTDYVEHNPEFDGIDWRPGFKHQFPWIGFAGLMVILVATAMAVAILVSSHKKRVKDWPFTR